MFAWQADAVITHADFEARYIEQSVRSSNVFVVPWAVPVKYRSRRISRKPVIAFVAHFAHAPNMDAAKWLVFDIMPLLRKSIPGIICRLIGSAMSHDTYLLAGDGVEVRGYVENLDTGLDDVSVCVAPLRYGAGIKGKVLTAWSLGIPVVMTSIAAEGLIDGSSTEWTDAIADDAEDFARKVTFFLNDAMGRRHLRQARKILRSRFSEVVIQGAFRDILSQAN